MVYIQMEKKRIMKGGDTNYEDEKSPNFPSGILI